MPPPEDEDSASGEHVRKKSKHHNEYKDDQDLNYRHFMGLQSPLLRQPAPKFQGEHSTGQYPYSAGNSHEQVVSNNNAQTGDNGQVSGPKTSGDSIFGSGED